MLKSTTNLLRLNLSLFDGGGAAGGGTGGAGAGTGDGSGQGSLGADTGNSPLPSGSMNSNPLANVKYGIQPEDKIQSQSPDANKQSQDDAKARQEAYDKFIKDNKDLDDKRVQSIVKDRLKNSKQSEQKYNDTQPLRQLMANYLGIQDADDVKALTEAAMNNDVFFEDEAIKSGKSVDETKSMYRFNQEKKALDEQKAMLENQQKAAEQYDKWVEQSKAVKELYPNFDLNAELENPEFVERLISASNSSSKATSDNAIRDAYRSIHFDELLSGGMEATAKKAADNVANRVKSNGMRPQENGMLNTSSAQVKRDVRSLTKADREECIRRARLGEKIVF